MRKIRLIILMVIITISLASIAFGAEAENQETVGAKTEITVDVGDNTINAIDKLANKLGMTGEKVYPYYVKQVKSEAIIDLLAVVSLLTILSAIIAFSTWSLMKSKYGSNAAVAGIVAPSLLFVIVLVIGMCTLSKTITKITNPEYAAVHQIMEDLKGVVK
jgi:hypothetical protein